MAQFNTEAVVVYQVYVPLLIVLQALTVILEENVTLNRMSWIKLNFLWMIYFSGWATKLKPEVVLAIWLKRSAFDEVMKACIPLRSDSILTPRLSSKFIPELYSTKQEWQQAIHKSSVRLQWDRTLRDGQLKRRAIQQGLRGDLLAAYARDWILHIENIFKLVREQYKLLANDRKRDFLVSAEFVYPMTNSTATLNLQLSIF